MPTIKEPTSIYVADIQPTEMAGHQQVRFVCLPDNIEVNLTTAIGQPQDDPTAVHPQVWKILADHFHAWNVIANKRGQISTPTGRRWPIHEIRLQLNEPPEGNPPRAHFLLLPTQTKIPLNAYMDHQYTGGLDVPIGIWVQLERRLGEWRTYALGKSDNSQPRAGFL